LKVELQKPSWYSLAHGARERRADGNGHMSSRRREARAQKAPSYDCGPKDLGFPGCERTVEFARARGRPVASQRRRFVLAKRSQRPEIGERPVSMNPRWWKALRIGAWCELDGHAKRADSWFPFLKTFRGLGAGMTRSVSGGSNGVRGGRTTPTCAGQLGQSPPQNGSREHCSYRPEAIEST